MSKINQIEKSLQQIDATSFHKLVDAYLSKAYSYHIISNGTKLGEDKPTKGTPDSFAVLENGNYVFIEYTTQKTNIKNKFLDDIGKCFDEERTGINLDNIERIILACNSDLTPEKILDLKNACNIKNVECIVLGNSTIANELFSRYSSISHEFLNISIDSGQILDYDDFIKNYDSNKYSTPLSTSLQCRDKEVENLYSIIDSSAIVLVTGVAGIGKTKLTLEVCHTYAEKNEYEFKAILNRGVNIFDDIKSYFGDENKRYLVLIDDVNRIHIALEYLQGYYGDQLQKGDIKIVTTVRDYAKGKIFQLLPTKLQTSEFELNVLNDDSIKLIVKNEYDITNPLYLDRIIDIAKGNPRLALMASSVAKQNENLESIYDVTSLYDEYFSHIKKDLEVFNQDGFLLAITIVSFFRTVDKSNTEQVELLEKVFGISINDLWKYIEELHHLEIFDLYENEVVKVSDQILSTYLFYKIVFVDQKIKIDIFIENFFPRYKARFVEVLNPLLNTFDTQHIINSLKEPVNITWEKYLGSEENLYEVMSIFWFLKQTDILAYFNEKINNLETEVVDINTLDFWNRPNNSPSNDDILERLAIFKSDTFQSMQIAIELILTYFQKRPSKLLKVINTLIGSYGFQYESYHNGYKKESLLLDVVWKYCDSGNNKLITKLYIQICHGLLKTEFENNKWKNNQFVLQSFKLAETSELEALRDKIFSTLFSLFTNEEDQKDILQLIREYPSGMGFRYGVSKIEQWDSKNIIQFIQNHFDPSSYEHTKVVHECLDAFDKRDIAYESKVRDRFMHPVCVLEKTLMLDTVDISLEKPRDKDEETDWDEIDKIKQNRLDTLIKNYNLSNWEELFEQCKLFCSVEGRDHYTFDNNLKELFHILAKKDPSLYVQVLKKYLELGNPFKLNLNLTNLINILGKEESYKLLQLYSYSFKESWLFSFFQDLPLELASNDDIQELLNLYKKAEIRSIPYHLDYLSRYLPIEANIFIQVTQILVERTINEDKNFKHGYEMLFNSHTDIFKNLEECFKNDLELLKQAYLLSMSDKNHFDHDCKSLNKLISFDSSFFQVYVNKLFEDKNYISSHDINGDFTSIWSREDFENIFFDLIELIFTISKEKPIWRGGEILKVFFSYSKNKKEIKEKIDYVIKKYIETFSNDEERMIFIFELISELSYGSRKEFISYFLQQNTSYEIFKKLSLEPSSFGWSGSRVPSLQKNKDYYMSLLDYMSSIQCLKHKQHIEKKISYIDQEIKNEKKKDFMDDY